MPTQLPCPVTLVILDGWGIGEPVAANAIHSADTPVMDDLLSRYPHTSLLCSGEHVGLPDGQMGNSEVGHLNIGAGRVVHQWITRIDRDIADGTFQRNTALREAFRRAGAAGGAVHLLGLLSDGGVHAHAQHLIAIIAMAAEWPTVPLRIHVFTDGRDTAPDSALGEVQRLQAVVDATGRANTTIASLSGRYYAMDRDNRWERVERAFQVITGTGGTNASTAVGTVEASYAAGTTDEFIPPVRIGDWGKGGQTLAPGDEAIFFNFRSDRARQLTRALTARSFIEFDRSAATALPIHMTTLTRYEDDPAIAVAYPPDDVADPIGKVISDAGLRQFRTAETEKYPHVTFFLNGGREAPFPGEDRVLVPSPKVATYDHQPEMSAEGVCDATVDAIASGDYHAVIVNFANPDMVGHTGDLEATRLAVETVDRCLGRVIAALAEVGGVALVTADHGNAEQMRVPGSDRPMTAHTTNPVPVVLVAPDGSPLRHATLRHGARLSAIGTTVIDLLGLPPQPTMTEPSLLIR